MGLWQGRAAILLFGLGFSLLLWGSGADLAVQQWLAAHYNQQVNDIARFLSWLGLGRNQVLGCLGAGVFVLFWRREPGAKWAHFWRRMKQNDLKRCVLALPYAARVWFACLPVFLAAGVLNLILKLMVGRPRPKEVLMNGMPYGDLHPLWATGHFKASLMSWPSGHTASTFAIGTLLMIAFPRWRWPLLAAMVLLSLARMFAIWPHYLGDVVAGATLGALVALSLAPHLGITKTRARR